uniref:Uncharacterized protein n=1 Tax=Populus trichocarpa TaxID=3694 RepID=U5FZX9_POPTR
MHNKLMLHNGPVLAAPVNSYIIWYGHWNKNHQATIRDFIYPLSSSPPYPSVADWWRAVRFHADQMELAGKEYFKILAFFPGFSRNEVRLFKVQDA